MGHSHQRQYIKVETCDKTGKRKYDSEEHATVLSKFLPAKFPNNRNVTTLRSYRCQFCGVWHITHMAKRVHK